MRLPFYFTTSVTTKLSDEQVKAVLYDNSITDNGKTSKDKKVTAWNKEQFEGTQKNYLYRARIKQKNFKLYRIPEDSVGGKPSNSFNPLCFGKIYQRSDGCTIKLTFRSAIFVLFFMAIWTSGALFGILGIFIHSLNQSKYQDALLALVFAVPFCLGFWLFDKFGFKKEVDRTLFFFESIGLTKNGR